MNQSISLKQNGIATIIKQNTNYTDLNTETMINQSKEKERNVQVLFFLTFYIYMGSPGGAGVKTCVTIQETWETQVLSLGWEDPLEEGMATYSSILTCRIPRTEEPGEGATVHRATKHRTRLKWLSMHTCNFLYKRSVIQKYLYNRKSAVNYISIMENNNIKISREARDNEPELNF